jgi:hypothetical protein
MATLSAAAALLSSSLEKERGSIFNPDTDCQLLLRDSHGIYIPQLYCADISEDDCEALSVSWEDVKTCQSGPDEELYWAAWSSICDSASWEENGEEFHARRSRTGWAPQ